MIVPAEAVLDRLARLGAWEHPDGAPRRRRTSGRLHDLARTVNELAARIEADWNGTPDDAKDFLTALAYARPQQLPFRLRLAGLLETLRLMLALGSRRTEALAYLQAQSRLDEALWAAIEHDNGDWARDADTLIGAAINDINAGNTRRVVSATPRAATTQTERQYTLPTKTRDRRA